jgi:SpoIID/LytB domain protein
MGQWGAFGYAQSGWTAAQILDHFYANTTPDVIDPNGDMTVRLTKFDGIDLITEQEKGHLQVTQGASTIVGPGGGQLAVRVHRNGPNSFRVDTAPNCGGPWTAVRDGLPSSVIVSPTQPDTDHTEMLQACEAGGSRWVRGSLWAVEGENSIRTVNHVALDKYVQGVVPRESPSTWPAAALQAQAVAARSYGWSENRYGYAKTCDTTACQVYGGVAFQGGGPFTDLEQPSTNAATTATAGGIRRLNGGVARTEFSSSTGGFSAGGTFPAVQDDGDATGGNPNHTWTASIPVATIQSQYPSIGQLSAVDVTQRNGLGDWGGRVVTLVLRGTSGNQTLSGDQFQAAFGLKSNWFTVVNNPSGGLVGYWVVARDGGVFTFGNARFYGSTGNMRLNQPVVGMAAVPGGTGYWLVASDGGIFSFGPGAQFYGSTGSMRLNKPIVGMAAAPGGGGYWLVASDGGIFTFGPGAQFYGSTGAMRLNKPIVGMAPTPTGRGYWLVASDGGIFTFGDAGFFGSTGSLKLNQPIVGMAARPQSDGYWLFARDGGVFTFGGAGFQGSMPGIGAAGPAAGGRATATGGGYLLVTADGRVYPFGDGPNFGGVRDQVANYTGTALGIDALAGSG